MLFCLFDETHSEIYLGEIVVLDFRLKLQWYAFPGSSGIASTVSAVRSSTIGPVTGSLLSKLCKLSKFLINIQSWEYCRTFLNLLAVHHFELKSVLPYHIGVPESHLLSDFL